MAKPTDFQARQYEFAAHIRDPQHVAAPEGIEDRRMAIYRDLFFNNLKSLLSNMFPVLKKLHAPEDWARLIRQFMIVHRASTPYFLQLLQRYKEASKRGYPHPQEGVIPASDCDGPHCH